MVQVWWRDRFVCSWCGGLGGLCDDFAFICLVWFGLVVRAGLIPEPFELYVSR